MAGPMRRAAAAAVLVLAATMTLTHHPDHPDTLAVDAGVLSTAAAWERWRAELERTRKRPRTVAAYRRAVWCWFAFLDGRGRRWERATPADLDAFLSRPAHTAAGGPLAPNTRLYYAVALVGFYRWAHRAGHLRNDRLAGVVLPRGGAPVPRALPLEAVATLLVKTTDPRTKLAIWLGYGCGLRASEIAAARIEHVRLHTGVPALLVPEGKGGYAGVVTLAAPVQAVLALALKDRPGAGPLVEHARRPGTHLTGGSVSRLLSRAMHAAGIAESGHSLRHTFATLLLEADPTALLAVSRLLRHQSPQTTWKTYVTSADVGMARAVGALPDPLVPARPRRKATR